MLKVTIHHSRYHLHIVRVYRRSWKRRNSNL